MPKQIKRERTVRHLPLNAYNKSFLIDRTKGMGLYKSKYNKAQLLEIYQNRIREVVKEVREKNKNDIHIISRGKKWAVWRNTTKRASRIFKDKGEAILYVITRWNYKIVIHNKDAGIDFIMPERNLILKN